MTGAQDEAIARPKAEAAPLFDESLILRRKAPTEPPYNFAWIDEKSTSQEYGPALVRISREYDRRF